jgi:hypothetical protein
MDSQVQKVLNTSKEESRKLILELGDEQLDELINNTSASNNLWEYALQERRKREFKATQKLHPVVWWSFGVAAISMVFAAIAAWPVIELWLK